jgi:tetratricopeptide (TPR) repeat protein
MNTRTTPPEPTTRTATPTAATLVVRAAIALALGAVPLGALLPGCASTPSAPDALADPLVAQRRGEELAYRAEQTAASGNTEQAIALYNESLAIYRNHPAAWNNLGVLLQARGNNQLAANCFLTATEMSPRNPVYPTNLALLFQGLRQGEEASKWLDLALERDPAHLPALRESVKLDHSRARLETDPKWKAYLLRQQDLVASRLRETGNLLGP